MKGRTDNSASGILGRPIGKKSNPQALSASIRLGIFDSREIFLLPIRNKTAL
jgi:hypothetical protein